MSLGKQAISGVFWTFSQQFGVQIINFVVQIILARLLLPEAFGIIALIQIFMSIGQTLMDGGMTSSLIRTVNADQKDYSSVFFINLLSSIVIYLVIFLLAPHIATFFSLPVLTNVLRVYTLTFIIQALVAVQTTKLTKEMNFKLQMYMQIPSTIIGGSVGVFLAYKDFGVWSLVWMSLVTTFLFMVQHWVWSDWRPSFIFDKRRFKYHFNFGYKLTLSALITNLYFNSFSFIIGKFFSATQLGYYNQAHNLRMFPVRNITSALQKVTYPIFSQIKDDNARLKTAFKRITSIVFFIVTPVMSFLILYAEPLYRIVLTEKWLPSVPFFQILCISAIFYPQSMYNLNVITAKGYSGLHFKLEVIKKGLSLFALLLIIPFGMWGVVAAQALSMLIGFCVNATYSGRMMNYLIKEQLGDIVPILSVSIITMLIGKGVDLMVFRPSSSNDLLRLLLGIVVFTLTYIGFCSIARLPAIAELTLLTKNFITQRKKTK